MSGLSNISTENLIREIVRRTNGQNVIHIIDEKNKEAISYWFECADLVRKGIKEGLKSEC